MLVEQFLYYNKCLIVNVFSIDFMLVCMRAGLSSERNVKIISFYLSCLLVQLEIISSLYLELGSTASFKLRLYPVQLLR